MRMKKRPEPEADVDMTPMIDMVFLLLVFFMCAATMSQVDLTPDIELPVAPKAAVPDDLKDRGTVNILPEGFLTPRGEAVTAERPFLVYGELLDREGLRDAISTLFDENPHLKVYMRIDKDTEFKQVRTAIQACAEAGVFDIIFASYQSASGG